MRGQESHVSLRSVMISAQFISRHRCRSGSTRCLDGRCATMPSARALDLALWMSVDFLLRCRTGVDFEVA